ncbi:unnamed protein product [Lathyrus sativus]|nr:unnamed protein product [Lathyrus sativus]
MLGSFKESFQLSPHHPESHNLHGLVCKAEKDYKSVATFYTLARHAVSIGSESNQNACIMDISINLDRSLSKVGNVVDALQECKNLKKEGPLDEEGLQVYAFLLWKYGKYDLALSIAGSFASKLSSMKKHLCGFILLFHQ